MSTSAGHTSLPETSEEDVVPEDRKPKLDTVHLLATPVLSPSSHPITPDSDLGPHSPASNPHHHLETAGMAKLAVADRKTSLAVPVDLHGAGISSTTASDGTPTSGGTAGVVDSGALATAGDTAGTNYGPNLGFPFPNIRPISGTASPSPHGMTIPPVAATPGASTPMSRSESADRIPPPKGSSPDPNGATGRTGRAPSVSARPAVGEPKKSFLHRMFHHDDKQHKDKHDAALSKLEMPKNNYGGWTPSGQPSPQPPSRDSPPMTPGTPSAVDSDGSRPPSRQSSFRTKKESDILSQMPLDARTNTGEGGGGGLMRRLSQRSASHGSHTDEKKDKDKVNGMKPVALVGGTPVAVVKKEEVTGQSGHKFTLKDLMGMGGETGKLQRRGSEKGSVKGSSTKGSEHGGGGDNGSTASLLKKYGVCDKAAIGKGATAVVRLAHKWDRREEKLYAVKEFRKRRKNETEKDYVKKLTSEFCISSTLHHPNIVETVDLVQDEQHHWCEVMEYCPGGDLYAAIKKGGMSSGEVECSFKQILLGISYLHNMGVAHRDIKPENLLLDGRGHVKITDFGVSDVFRMCWEKKTHLSKGLCGSEPYIAPELFDQKEYDARLVDVWAAAVVFYCMQFQELPWRVAKQSDTTFAAYLAAYAPSAAAAAAGTPHPTAPPLNNLVPRECRSVIKHMLDPDPKTRWGIDEVLKDKWVAGINICKEGEVNDHTHVSAGLEIVKL